MALVTTFITTPLLHVVYISKRAPKVKKEESKDIYTAFLGVQDLSATPWMVKAVNLFSGMREGFYVKALMMNEISDRPSSYFFSEYYSMIQDMPLTKGTKLGKTFLTVKNNAKQLGLNMDIKNIASSDLTQDVARYCTNHACNLLLFNLMYDVEIRETNQDTSFSLTQSISTMQDKVVQTVLTYDPTAKVIESTMSRVSCAVGVLVYKRDAMKAIGTEPLQRVLALITAPTSDHESLVLAVLTKSKNVAITILTSADSEVTQIMQGRDNVTIIPSTVPELDIVKEAKKDYDLLVIGAARSGAHLYESHAIKEIQCPVLVLYPAIEGHVTPSNSVSHSHGEVSSV